MTLLEKFLFERDLEYSIGNYFKKDSTFEYEHMSNITQCNIKYLGSQLMTIFSVEAEIEIYNILKMKYGDRTKHIGGIDATDIIIQGSPYAFNVKTLNENSGSIKLCSINSPNKLKDLDYRFVVITYKLSETQESLVFNNVFVFSFDLIKDVLISRENNYFIAKGKILEYIHRRNAYVNGETLSFKKITLENIKPNKPELNSKMLHIFIQHKKIVSLENIRKRFNKFELKNLQNLLLELENNELISFKNNNYCIEQELKIEKTKFELVKELYKKFLEGKLNKVENIKDFRKFLREQHNISSKLSSTYTLKLSKN